MLDELLERIMCYRKRADTHSVDEDESVRVCFRPDVSFRYVEIVRIRPVSRNSNSRHLIHMITYDNNIMLFTSLLYLIPV